MGRSQWPRHIRRGSATTRLLEFWVRIPLEHGSLPLVSVVSSGRGLCDGLITRPEESYRVGCVVVCDRESSIMRRPWSTGGCCAMGEGGWVGER